MALSPSVDLDAWDPWSPADAAKRLRDVSAPWYVLAGWALDLFLGRQTREHDDLEIGVPEHRFREVRVALGDLEPVVVGSGRAWPMTEQSLRDHRQTWFREPGGPWRLDVIRERWDDDVWVCGRDPRIRVHATKLISRTSDGIPFVQPEIALLFKARSTRPKDALDFATVLPQLDGSRRAWLRDALELVHPDHVWLGELAGG